jgi:hypothetical protein
MKFRKILQNFITFCELFTEILQKNYEIMKYLIKISQNFTKFHDIL